MSLLNSYKGKKVLITGHTGFKGTWISLLLKEAGAEVTGYALNPPTSPSLFDVTGMEHRITSIIGDVRDYEHLMKVFADVQPEFVFHLAAQPLVLKSYENPAYTYETNVMGTVNVCECVRRHSCVRSFLNVTTDKVYENKEWEWGYRETEALDGFDPYSNSKSCSELVTHSYINSFYSAMNVAASTARAGNVIGGGDFAENRIVPDGIKAALEGKEILVRNPYSTRPYQHVLEPLYMYLVISAKQYEDRLYSGYYNVGPDDGDCVTTGELANLICESWQEGLQWKNISREGPHEANFLKLDCSKAKKVFGWKPVWNIKEAVDKTVEWSKAFRDNKDMTQCMLEQIRTFKEAWEKIGNEETFGGNHV